MKPPIASAGTRSRDFESMADPPLADRLRSFELYLEAEPCEVGGSCVVQSVSSRMCPPCRLRLRFHHCLYNAEAYEGGPGAIPRRSA
jgi:hypothetical protein